MCSPREMSQGISIQTEQEMPAVDLQTPPNALKIIGRKKVIRRQQRGHTVRHATCHTARNTYVYAGYGQRTWSRRSVPHLALNSEPIANSQHESLPSLWQHGLRDLVQRPDDPLLVLLQSKLLTALGRVAG